MCSIGKNKKNGGINKNAKCPMQNDNVQLKNIERISELKKERQAIILAHNYQSAEVQDIADYVGDSLELSIKAASTDAQVIVFCGVSFMAETAAILSPKKKVLIPDMKAGCHLADMIDVEQLKELKKKHPQAKVLSYVNTSADVKAISDLCCTSANAVEAVQKLSKDAKEIIFVPDKHLAHYASAEANCPLIIWNGYCSVHMKISARDVLSQKKRHPQAKVIVHPECNSSVVAQADEVISTGRMCKYAKKSKHKEMIVGTDIGMLYRLRKENPTKLFYSASGKAICADMRLITLEKILYSLQKMEYEVKVDKEIALKAKGAIEKML